MDDVIDAAAGAQIILAAMDIFRVHLSQGFSPIGLLSLTNDRAQFGPPGYETDLPYIAWLADSSLSAQPLGP